MNYADMHCDTLTVCADKKLNLRNCNLQTDLEKLKKGGCALQCFAVFTQDGQTQDYGSYRDFFEKSIKNCSDIAEKVENTADFARLQGKKVGCILTVENLGFLDKELSQISRLAQDGVKMASLVWNYKNLLAKPNLIFKDGVPQFATREDGGLTALGRQAVELLDAHGIILDISHLSDGGAREILSGRKTPIVASHSNVHAVCGVCRNLTDELIRKIADCGGAIGLNFCADFLGERGFDCIYRHLVHLINVGGEDVVALGSDFDGIPENPDLPDCTHVQSLFEYLRGRGIPHKTLEKFALSNFLRVFEAVCG